MPTQGSCLPITDIVVMVSGGDIFDDYYKYLDLSDDYILNHVDQKNIYFIKVINFIKSNTLTYQLITRITPPKVIPGLIKSIFSKKDSIMISSSSLNATSIAPSNSSAP